MKIIFLDINDSGFNLNGVPGENAYLSYYDLQRVNYLTGKFNIAWGNPKTTSMQFRIEYFGEWMRIK